MMALGRGSISGKRNLRRIVIGFDDETFAQIRQRATREKSSFAEQVRLLTEWGLEADNGTL